MSLVGNLEDLGLGEILQIVSLSRKSGILSLYSKGREGKIYFRNGQVTQATSSSYRQSLGEVLVGKGIIDLNQLKLALAIQERESFCERLGSILVRCFGVVPDAIEEVVRQQIEKVVYSLFIWSEGTFDFDLQESVDAPDHIRMDPMQFMLDEGLNPQYLAMEGSRIIDEQRHRVALGQEAEELEEGERSGSAVDFDLLMWGARPDQERIPDRVNLKPVVLVDDDAATREALGFLVSKAGYEPLLSDRGEDALIRIDTLCRDRRPPLVVVDLYMPRMDGSGVLGGLELIELLHHNFPHLPLVALADYPDLEVEQKVRLLGCSHVLKPRRIEISDPAVLKEFRERLLPSLEAQPREERPANRKINLGDVLRLELGEEGLPQPAPIRQGKGLSLLRGMLDELNSSAQGGGIILMVLRFASEFMNRAIMFIVKKDEIAGLGQFGLMGGDRSADTLVRGLRIPRESDTLFRRVIDTPFPVRLHPDDSSQTRSLFERLGDGVPEEIFLGPLISDGKVAAILYGDNLPGHDPIGDTEGLEIFLTQAGLAMEKALLQRRIKEQSEDRP